MASVSTAFRPQSNGFRFVNSFNFSLELELPLVGSVELGKLVLGLCGGMCFASLDYFHGGRQIPQQSNVPPVGSSLHVYLLRRQLDSLSLPGGVLRVLEWMILPDTEVGRRTASTEFPKMRRRLDSGKPAVLALIRQGGLADPTQNHQVVAWGYDYDEATKRAKVHIYDPNRPNQSPTLSMDFSQLDGGISAAQSTGEPLRGFFQMNYRIEAPPS